MDANKCADKGGKVKAVYIGNASDWHWKDGKFVMKRKYGKFKREMYKLQTK